MKRYYSILMTLILAAGMVLSSIGAVFAQNNSDRVVDGADILTSSEEQSLESELAEWCDDNEFDIAILTMQSSLSDDQLEAYADDYYDKKGYGYGNNYNGCILVIDMGSRAVWISTSGYGEGVLTDVDIDSIVEDICDYLGSEDYYDAIEEGFISNVKWTYNAIANGEGGDSDGFSNSLADIGTWGGILGMGLFPGLGIAFVMARAQKSKLKTIRKKTEAQNYIRPGSLNITRSHERFLYSHVSRTPKPKDDGRNGGSTIHTSSSGRTHGGGGGHF